MVVEDREGDGFLGGLVEESEGSGAGSLASPPSCWALFSFAI